MEGRILICQHNSFNSHLGLTPHIPPSTTLPMRPGPDLPQPLPLPASIPEPSRSSELSSQQIPVPVPGVGVPQAKEGLWQANGASDPSEHTSLLPVGIPNSSYAFPVPARLRSEAPPGLCFRPHVSLASVSFLFPPPPTPPHPYAPFNRHPLLLPSSFPPLCLGEGVLSPCTMDLLAFNLLHEGDF